MKNTATVTLTQQPNTSDMSTSSFEHDVNNGLEEAVLTDCFFHIERMNDRSFWIGVSNETGLYHINLYIDGDMLKANFEKQS